MWLATQHGFFSIVRAHQGDTKKPHPNLMMIRARCRDHLEGLKIKHPGLPEIVQTEHTDYPYRMIVPRTQAMGLMYLLIEEVDYTNFKNRAQLQRPQDAEYHKFLHTTWANGLCMHDDAVGGLAETYADAFAFQDEDLGIEEES